MEDYRLEQSGQEVQDILNGAAMQVDLTAENERAELAEQTLQGNIDAEALARENADGVLQGHIDDEETRAKAAIDDEALARENADIELQGHIDDEETRAKAAEKQNADDIDAIEEKIPTQASSSNQLADKDFVEDLVSTSSATFRGTFNLVSDLHLTVDASYTNIAAALGNAIAGADNNDFAFVMIPTSVDTPNEIARIEKYKFNGSVWGFEYVLNNSGFTAAQWAAINSGITSALVTKLGALPSAADLAAALLAKQDKLTFDQAPTPSSTNPVTSGGVYTAIDDEKGARVNADAALQQAIEAILLLIPSAATALNQLADKDFVNSSITTATATFRGTFNLVSDLQLTVDATHTDIAAALLNAISTADNNDYVFVQIPTSVDTPTEIRVTERYKFNGTAWQYEYDLNNSGFTSQQWEAINSAITSALVSKLSALPTAAELATELAGKQAVLTFDNHPTSGSSNPVKSGGVYDVVAAINAKIPSDADAANKMTTEARIATIIGALDATFDLTSADGHVTFKMTQTDGLIASVQILTYDIASAAALTTLGGRVSLNESDISNLQAAYAALTQSDIVIVNGALPSSGQQQNVIYRQLDPDHTPPQFYSDFMWNGTTWVLMAQYNNAIDPRPKKGSQNLVTSGGVFDNMGALDVSELNATENPHTLATYADLSAALAAIPSDYQKGGMSIKYVQSSDNKYVQWRLMAQSFITDETQWYNEEVKVLQITETNNPIANAITINGQKYDVQDARTSGMIGVSGNKNITANQKVRFDMIQVLEGYSYTLKLKSTSTINLIAITSNNDLSGARYYWGSLGTDEQLITFVATQSIVLQIWTAANMVPNDATISWEIAFTKVVEKDFEIINDNYFSGYLNNDGSFVSFNGFKTSPFVDVSDCTKIKFNIGDTPYINSQYNLIHYYDSNHSHISTADVHTITTGIIYDVPTTAKYVRYFVNASYDLFELFGNTDRDISTIIYVGNYINCKYKTLQDAIDNCNDSEQRPITIILLPGIYERFTMRTPDQPTERWVDMKRYISIIGIDKNLCKVVSNENSYWTPAAEIGTVGVIENISFITEVNAEPIQPTYGGAYVYAVHADWRLNGRKTTFRNCYFESNAGPAAGCGLHQDEKLEFIDCMFIRKTGYGPDLGAFFCHSNTTEGVTNQNLVLRGCSVKNFMITEGVVFGISLSGTTPATILSQNTISKNTTSPNAYIQNNWTKDDMSFNNIPTSLNA